MESIQSLQDDYAFAKNNIFKPATTLMKLVETKPEMLQTCFDLCLGRVSYLVQDGELVLMERHYEQPEWA